MPENNPPLNNQEAATLLRRFANDKKVSDEELVLIANYLSACTPVPRLNDSQNQRRYLA